MAYTKIKVEYPDGRSECLSNVTETYRNALRYIGLEEVRALAKMRNGINIISTREEIEKSSGKKEEVAIFRADPTTQLCICTQFDTEDKYNILNEINEALHKNLKIILINPEEDTTLYVAEEKVNDEIREGLLKEYNATRYERNPTARSRCLGHYGDHVVCQVCGFDFEKTYGQREKAEPFIEIHHINPHSKISAKEGEHKVDCVKDLIPVCANCHRMLHHYKKNKTLYPDELRKILESQKANNN